MGIPANLTESIGNRDIARTRLVVMMPELSINQPASRTRCYAVASKLSNRREILLLSIQSGRSSALQLLFNTVALCPLSRKAHRHLTLYAQRGSSSIVRVGLLLLLRKLTEARMVFDFDDAVFLDSPRGTRAMCRAADAVLVATEYLARYARQFSKNVFVLPTSIDLALYQRPRNARTARGVPVVGWIGTPSNLGYLKPLMKPLQRLSRSNDFTLTLITDPSKTRGLNLPPGIQLKIIPWTLGDFIQRLATFDVGVCPLPDDEWTRGKSSYKVLEYMALGIPPVASPIGGITDVITHGTDGLMATTQDEWHACLRNLIENPESRREMGRAARSTVEKRFSMETTAAEIGRLLDHLDGE